MIDKLIWNISFDNPANLPPFTPLTPELKWAISIGDPLAFHAISEHASTIKEALQLNSIYNIGDSIMANVLNAYNGNFSDTAENELTAISTTEGEMIGSLKISNTGGSNADVTIKIKNSGDTVLFQTVETLTSGENSVTIDGLERMNLLTGDKITVQSNVGVSVFYYLSTVNGVDV